MGVQPLADKIIIKRLEERTTEGGLIIPETVGNKSQKGTVVAVGPGKYDNGKLQKMHIKCNDTVIFGKYAGTEITISGKDYIVLKEDDIVAIIN
ncbi:MAG TPA: co-chaperone GroES [Candidatus Azoamicus sp. OHIO2]